MIDVIIPAYNCSKTIGRTLSSLVAQTDNNFNVIIVDDCSTEDFSNIVNDYKKLLNIIYIKNDVNMGAGMSRQVGINNSLSKFIVFLDSDDMFMPYTIETFNTAIGSNPNLEILHTYFYEQMYVDDVATLALHKDNYTACHGKLYNVEVIRKFGIEFVPEVVWSEDAFFNSMCTELMQVGVLKIPTYIWTFNTNSLLHNVNEDRDKNKVKYFVKAMKRSSEFVKKYKKDVSHLEASIQQVLKDCKLNDDDKKELDKLLQGGE